MNSHDPGHDIGPWRYGSPGDVLSIAEHEYRSPSAVTFVGIDLKMAGQVTEKNKENDTTVVASPLKENRKGKRKRLNLKGMFDIV